MAGLISLDVAKVHLRITDHDHDTDVQLKLLQAEESILVYVKPKRTGETRPDWPWTAATLPYPVQAAMLVLLEYLYDAQRSNAESAQDPKKVWAVIEGLVGFYRDRAIA